MVIHNLSSCRIAVIPRTALLSSLEGLTYDGNLGCLIHANIFQPKTDGVDMKITIVAPQEEASEEGISDEEKEFFNTFRKFYSVDDADT